MEFQHVRVPSLEERTAVGSGSAVGGQEEQISLAFKAIKALLGRRHFRDTVASVGEEVVLVSVRELAIISDCQSLPVALHPGGKLAPGAGDHNVLWLVRLLDLLHMEGFIPILGSVEVIHARRVAREGQVSQPCFWVLLEELQ